MDLGVMKLEQDLASMEQRNGEEQVRSRSMDQERHIMIGSGSYHLVIVSVHVLHWHIGGRRWKWKGARQSYNLGLFISPVKD